MLNHLREIWPDVTAVAFLLISLIAAGHAVLFKRDPRAAVSWIGVIFLLPFFGALLYVLLGINRIQRKAFRRRSRSQSAREETSSIRPSAFLPENAKHLVTLANLVEGVTKSPLLDGNTLEPLCNGDEAYPAMTEAIEGAEKSITLATYIFDNDRAGSFFVDALAGAVKRGVEVRVLIDYVGSRYSFPSVIHRLHRVGVKAARFMPTFLPWRTAYFNLRSHRKIMVVDGRVGFTGGINIRYGCMLRENPPHPVQDLHFRVQGPLVGVLQETFAEDWGFTTGEKLQGLTWFLPLEPVGSVVARAILDGPDKDVDKLRRVLHGALACAERSVRIVTPYFLPDMTLMSALGITAMRGVKVDILIPRVSNLRLVQWACTAQLWQVLERGCRVWLTEPPFDHSKIMLVDDIWGLVGSSNWDPRSLRLNFECDVEFYSEDLAAQLNALLEEKKRTAHPLTRADVDRRPLPIKLRDGVARLFLPYL